MKIYAKIVLLIAFACLPLVGFSQKTVTEFAEEKQSIELTINGEKFIVENLPRDGFIEVFNILGSKVMSFTVKNGINTTRINLPEGYYILKGDNNVTKKIVVK